MMTIRVNSIDKVKNNVKYNIDIEVKLNNNKNLLLFRSVFIKDFKLYVSSLSKDYAEVLLFLVIGNKVKAKYNSNHNEN